MTNLSMVGCCIIIACIPLLFGAVRVPRSFALVFFFSFPLFPDVVTVNIVLGE